MTPATMNALRGYGVSDAAAAQKKPQNAAGPPAGDASFSAVHALAGAIGGAERQAQGLIVGGADPHSVIQALAQAELAVETAVTIRDKVVEAYQEILRMPV